MLIKRLKKQFYLLKQAAKKLCCRLLKRPLHTVAQQEIFAQLAVGDIVYARMPLPEAVLYDIAPEHKNRPYLIVQKDENSLVAFPATHSYPAKYTADELYILKASEYPTYLFNNCVCPTKYDSHFKLKEPYILPLENIFYHTQSLKPLDLALVARKLAKMRVKDGRTQLYALHPLLRCGDVLKQEGEYYYVYQEYKQTLYTHPLKPYSPNVVNGQADNYVPKYDLPLRIYGHSFYVDTGRQTVFAGAKLPSAALFHICSESVVKRLEEEKKELKHSQKYTQKQKQRPKQGGSKSNTVSFRFKVGTQFYTSAQRERGIYLFTLGNKHYGFFLEPGSQSDWAIEQIVPEHFLSQDQPLERAKLQALLPKLECDSPEFKAGLERVLERESLQCSPP